MLLRVIGIAAACILVDACQGAADSSESPPPVVAADSLASAVQVREGAADEDPTCDEDSLPSELFASATAADPAVLVDRCGVGRGLVRRDRGSGAVTLLPFPEGFREALTSFDVSADDRFITFVEFDGENGAYGVVRSFPQGTLVTRSRRLTVHGGDTACGGAEFVTDSTWVAYVCAAVPGQDLWVRLRAPIRGGVFAEDTVEFASAPPIGRPCPSPANGSWCRRPRRGSGWAAVLYRT
jgi:hypothetical protein